MTRPAPRIVSFASNAKLVKKLQSEIIGLGENADGYSVEELLSAVTEEQYHRLVGFARLRLRAGANSRWLRKCLAITDAEELVNQAILKLHLGEHDASLGRHLKARNRGNMEAFVACIKGVMSSDLYNLANAARNRYEQLAIGDPEQESEAIDPADPEDTWELLSRRDLHRVFFKKLYGRIENQPALLAVVRDWEQRAFDDDRIGGMGISRDRVYRVRQLAREVITELGAGVSPRVETTPEM